MILTEKEAAEKACCDGGYGAVVRTNDESRYNCIVLKCMAWRWFDAAAYEHSRRGYCGLAGKPEVAL